jgi:hypothetical protein
MKISNTHTVNDHSSGIIRNGERGVAFLKKR